ncbi:MAG: PIN domain-containing protein [Vicinamibacterales bacterium]
MNLVLDTNVLVAALVARGVCGDLLEHCVRSHTVVSSSALLDELREVLTRKFHQRDADVRAAVGLFAETFTLVTPPVLEPVMKLRLYWAREFGTKRDAQTCASSSCNRLSQ